LPTDEVRDDRPEILLMAWIAFACVPTMLVVMLAMAQLEDWMLPQAPSRPGHPDPAAGPDTDDHPEDLRARADLRADLSTLRWEIPAATISGTYAVDRPDVAQGREEARA